MIQPAPDFTLSYNGTYNIAQHTVEYGAPRDYYTHTFGFRLNLIGPHGIALRDELSNNYSAGQGIAYDQNAVLFNAGVAKKFFTDQRGELRLTASDVLNQNRSISRTVTESYTQDTRNRTLGPTLMLTFTYNMK